MYSVVLDQSQNDVSSIGSESICQRPKSIPTTSPKSSGLFFFPHILLDRKRLQLGENLHFGQNVFNICFIWTNQSLSRKLQLASATWQRHLVLSRMFNSGKSKSRAKQKHCVENCVWKKKQTDDQPKQTPSGVNKLIQSQLRVLSSHAAAGFELQQVDFPTSTCRNTLLTSDWLFCVDVFFKFFSSKVVNHGLSSKLESFGKISLTIKHRITITR